MAEKMYQNVGRHSTKKDWKIVVVILAAVLISAAIIGLTVYLSRTQYLYNKYRGDMVSSVVYAMHHGSLTAFEGDEQLEIREELGEVSDHLFFKGKLVKAPETQPDLTIYYGDGSFSRYWRIDYTDNSGIHGPEVRPGMILEYTNCEGKTYCVETGENYERMHAWLTGNVQEYYSIPNAG